MGTRKVSMARLVVTAVLVEGRTKSEVARDYGVSRRWVITLVQRFLAEGDAGLEPHSRQPRRSPQRIDATLEDEIVEIRKALDEAGHDRGAHTIAFHLERRHGHAPSVSTIWRVLGRRGFIVPQAAQASEELLCPLRSGPAERALAARRHPLGPWRRHRGGDPQSDRRPLPPGARLRHPAELQGRRRRHLLPVSNRTHRDPILVTPRTYDRTVDAITRATRVAEEAEGLVGFEPQALSGEQAAACVDRLSRAARLCLAACARAAARVEECGTYRGAGARSGAEWLARRTGTTLGQASASLQTAKAVEGLPATKAAFVGGDLSELQAQVVARAAAADPSAEVDLLATAQRCDVKTLRDRARQ